MQDRGIDVAKLDEWEQQIQEQAARWGDLGRHTRSRNRSHDSTPTFLRHNYRGF